MSTSILLAASAIVATTCVLSLRRAPLVIGWQYAFTGVMLAIAVGAYTALQDNSDELLRRAKTVCLGRGGHTAIVSARAHSDRVYCAHGARAGYTLP